VAQLKKLFGQTAVYGISSILARFLNYLLVPLYAYIFQPEEAGIYVEYYAYIAFFIVILTFGMETAFFRYYQFRNDKETVYSTSFWTVFSVNFFFLLIIFLTRNSIATTIGYPHQSYYVILSAMIVALDAISSIPFAYLRSHQKAWRFAFIKTMGILVNILFNLILILFLPWLYKHHYAFFGWLQIFGLHKPQIVSIFISNLLSSFTILLMLVPELKKVKLIYSSTLFKEMILYALPLLILGIAGIINENADRILLKNLLPAHVAMYQVGIYGMCYKMVIIVSVIIQAFRYAAEPFFFEMYKQKDAKKIYADLMNYFISFINFIIIGTIVYMDFFKYFVGPKYYEGLKVVPLLLYSHVFLGIVYNLSIWYKLTDKTIYGAIISITGSTITILLNILLIPHLGYVGSAIANFTCYVSMAVLSYVLGQKYYPVPYDLKKLGFYIILPVIYTLLSMGLVGNHIQHLWLRTLFNTLLFLSYILLILKKEPALKQILLSRLQVKIK
jgi:O-antigen/teichoic acid export membrane protein